MTTRFTSKATRAAALLATVAGLGVLADSSAQTAAASGSSWVTQSVNLRGCASTSSYCTTRWNIAAGTHVAMTCWEDAQWAYGTNRWFIVFETSSPGLGGWVPATSVANQSRVGHC